MASCTTRRILARTPHLGCPLRPCAHRFLLQGQPPSYPRLYYQTHASPASDELASTTSPLRSPAPGADEAQTAPERGLDELDRAHLRVVAAAEVPTRDARVTAFPLRVAVGRALEERVHELLVVHVA